MAGRHTRGCFRYQRLNPIAKVRCICEFIEEHTDEPLTQSANTGSHTPQQTPAASSSFSGTNSGARPVSNRSRPSIFSGPLPKSDVDRSIGLVRQPTSDQDDVDQTSRRNPRSSKLPSTPQQGVVGQSTSESELEQWIKQRSQRSVLPSARPQKDVGRSIGRANQLTTSQALSQSSSVGGVALPRDQFYDSVTSEAVPRASSRQVTGRPSTALLNRDNIQQSESGSDQAKFHSGIVANTSESEAQTGAAQEVGEELPWKTVARKKDVAVNTRKSEDLPAKSDTKRPAWTATKPIKAAKSVPTFSTAEAAAAELSRLREIIKGIPPGGLGYREAASAFLLVKDQLTRFSQLSRDGDEAFPKLAIPAQSLTLPAHTPMLDPFLAQKPKKVVTPIDIDISGYATALARCGPLSSLLLGAWRFLRVRGTLCGKELVKGRFCEEEHPQRWHDLIYSVPLIEHWTNAQIYKEGSMLAGVLKDPKPCKKSSPYHYPDSCGAGMFRLNSYSMWHMFWRLEQKEIDAQEYLYFRTGFDMGSERHTLHPACYIPKGTAIKVAGVTVCNGFDFPAEYAGHRPKFASGYGAGLTHRKIDTVQGQFEKLNNFLKKDLNATPSYRVDKVDKVKLDYVVESIYHAVNVAVVEYKFTSEEDLRPPDLPFWKPVACDNHLWTDPAMSTSVSGNRQSGPNKNPLTPASAGVDQSSSIDQNLRNDAVFGESVDNSAEARKHWISYGADPNLPPSGYFIGSTMWPAKEHWARIDQELNHPNYTAERKSVDDIHMRYQQISNEIKKCSSNTQRKFLKIRMTGLVSQLEKTCSPVIRAWPLAKNLPQAESPAKGSGSGEQLFECSCKGFNSSHSQGRLEVLEEVSKLPPLKEKPEEHLKHFSDRLLQVQLTSARMKDYKKWLSDWWDSAIKPEAIENRVNLLDLGPGEAELLGLQTDAGEVHRFLKSIMSDDLKGQTVPQIIDELFEGLLRYARMFRDGQTHTAAITHHRQHVAQLVTEYQRKLTARFNLACAQADKPYIAPSAHVPNVHANAGSIRKLFFHPEFEAFRCMLCNSAFPGFYLPDGLPQLIFPNRAVQSFLHQQEGAEASARE